MLNLAYLMLALGIAAIGLFFQLRVFAFIGGVLFVFLGLASDEVFIMVIMIVLGIFLMFNTFFEWRPPK